MDIRYSGKNIKVTEGMKDHCREKINKLDKYAPRIVESHVILKKEKILFIAEITLLAKNFKAYGEGRSKVNVFAAIDEACAKTEKQLKKYREKVKDHHRHGGARAALKGMKVSSFSAAEEEEEELSEFKPRVIQTPGAAVKPMSVEEASLQLEISKDPFLVFQNSLTRQFNVIYKRQDGHHVLVGPQV